MKESHASCASEKSAVAPTLAERAARFLAAKIPGAVSGSGGHDQTYAAACVLVKGFGLTVDEARPLMRDYNARCEPPWSEREIEYKLASADRAPDTRPRGWLAGDFADVQVQRPVKQAPFVPTPKAVFNPHKLAAFAGAWKDKITLRWLAEQSPVNPLLATTQDFLSSLYRHGENVVIFTDQKSQGQALWPGAHIPPGGPDGVWFLAQPVDGMRHHNPRTGRVSRRSEESVTDWRFLVIESDEANRREWMAALVQLPLRIAAIYTSGGRSIHALVRVDAASKEDWDAERDAIKEPLIVLGADPKSLSAVRLTRLPGCLRGNALQKLLYLNPAPSAAPICELPPVRDVQAANVDNAPAAQHRQTGKGDA